MFSAVRLVGLQSRPPAQGTRARRQTAPSSIAACRRALVPCAAPSAASRTASSASAPHRASVRGGDPASPRSPRVPVTGESVESRCSVVLSLFFFHLTMRPTYVHRGLRPTQLLGLRGAIRDHVTKQRRPFVRFFACEEDFSHHSPDAPLPDAVASGAEPFLVVGALSGG